MARNTDPFTPRGPLDRDTLERYAQGLLSAEECHEVELHLERDPLLREALEGLMAPGAVEAARSLHRPPPSAGPGRWPVRILAGALLVGGTLFTVWQAQRGPKPHTGPVAAVDAPQVVPAAVESTLKVVDQELEVLAQRPALPEPEADREENFRQPAAAKGGTARASVDRLEVQPTVPGSAPERPTARKPAGGNRTSRQLVFLHGMKLVHPSELPWAQTDVQGSPGSPANSEQASRDRIPSGPAARPYLDLMDEAMGAFARNEHRRALDDLYFILGQHPDDVNAQFYAGLACYHLGLYPRAAKLLRAAAGNPVDSFNEEAEWYGALTMERMEGSEAARPAFERIASEGGFYAEQARRRLVP